MKKRVKRFLTMLMTLALVIGSVDYSALAVQAAETTTKYYTFNDVSGANVVNGTWGVGTPSVSAAGAMSLSFSGQYAETQHTLPAGVDGTTVSQIKLHVAQGDATNIAVKVYADGAEADVNYSNAEVTVDVDLSGATEVVFGIMNNNSGALEGVVIDYFTITAVQTGGSDSAPSAGTGGGEGEAATLTTKYYTFNDVSGASVVNGTWGVGTPSISAAGAMSLSFSGQYAETQHTLPAGVDGTTVSQIKLHVAQGDATNIVVKVYADGAEADVNYSNAEVTVDVDLSGATEVVFGIMNNNSGALEGVVIDYFTITAVQTGGSDSAPSTGNEGGDDTATPTTKYYTFNDVTGASVANGTWGVTKEVSEAGALSVAYSSQYAEAQYTLPEGVDPTTVESISFNVSNGDTSVFAVKIYADGTEVGVKYGGTTLDVTADLSEAESVVFGLMSTSTAAEDFVVDYFSITAVQTGGSDSAPSTDAGGDEGEGGEGDATTYTKYYTFNDVTMGEGYGATTSVSETGTLALSYPADYSYPLISFTFPEGVDTSTIESMYFNISGETNYKLAVKLFAEEIDDSWDNKVQVSYGVTGDLTVNDDAKGQELKYFALMNSQDKVALEGLSIDYFTITTTTEQTGGSDTAPGAGDEGDGDEGDDTIPEAQYTFNDVVDVKTHQATITVDEATGVATIDFSANYGQVAFTFPDDLDTSLITSLKLVGNDVSGLSIKVYADEAFPDDFSGEEKVEYSSSMSINTALTGTLNYFVIMNISGDAKSYEVAGFDTTVAEELGETYEINLGANDLTLLSITGDATSALVGDAHNVTFKTYNSDEVKYTLPDLINMEKCISMTVTVADQVGPMNYYFYSGSTRLGSNYYNPANDTNQHVIEFNPKLTGKMDAIGIQLGGEANTDNAQIKILGVTFVMEGTEPLDAPTDGIYTYSHFIDQEESDGTTVEVDETDYSSTITFANAGDTVTLPVPDAIDLNHLVSIDMIAEGAENVKIVLLDKNGNELMSTNASTIETKCNPEIAFIQLVSTAATTMELTGFKFNVDPEAFESIILNGNFAREDVSMWQNALWGDVDGVSTTITAKTSDTELVNGIYTYGEVSRRSSPYVCFAQDVTDRVEPGKGYYVGAWVKLDEEDYADAAEALRIASLGVYYLDANGKENYGLFQLGNDAMVCEPGEWTYLWGRFNLPENATGCVVRILEQGTNYGQGDCVMGSYAVTGVTMSESPIIPQATGGGGGGTNTTITKQTNWIESYDMDDMLLEWASASATKSGSTLKMTFKNNYDEARMDLPRELDAADMAYVKTKVSSNVPMAVKLYYKGSQVDVGYYNTIKDEYILVPSYTGKVDAIGIMSLATPNPAGAWATFNGIEFGLTEEPDPIPPRTSIVLNGDFSNEDLADWKASFFGEGVTMTRKTSSTEIAPGVYNYASYSKRTSPYQCFAQDITEAVVEGETYTFSFWARLSDAYEGAPESQRIIQFAPYTVDSDGNADYNPRLDGNYLQVCEPGVWTYFEGTYKVTNPNNVAKVVIRILEQGTNYGQGECVLGGFDIADVKMDLYVPEPPSIDEDVPNLKDALAEDFGDDFYTGTAVTLDEIEDIGIEMLVNKHFNAVTLGNELKPDALFNYSNSQHTELKTVTFNGQELVVPTLNYARAEEVLDKILEWNETHPESPILVKGHVLVWHSQTPEWFFRENYVVGTNADGTPNYVSAEEMNLRLEWYISEVLNHFLGEDSPYKDMFYAWDVVNEAVSNGNSGYRTDKASAVEDPNADTHSANSSWWGVYQSNEYIINAFKYANKYAPADIELYYNDYNECDSGKMKGIVQLLTDVKNAEGTRIDGMGMQGHYNMFNPSAKDIEKAIRAYAAVVGKVNYSELDMKVSGDVSTEDKLQNEYLAQAERYHDIYQVLLKLDAEEDIEISGITWWGTVDHYSWLQESSELGGGANGGMTQCPLLFDTKYKVKPSYWAFVDYTMVDPNWVPEGEETPEVEEPKEEPKEEPVVEDTPTEEPTAEPAEKTEDTSSDAKEEKSMAPFAVAGGVGVAIIAASAAILFRKKK